MRFVVLGPPDEVIGWSCSLGHQLMMTKDFAPIDVWTLILYDNRCSFNGTEADL